MPPNCCAFPKNREPLPSSTLSPGALKRKGQISVTSVSYHIIANDHILLQCIRSRNKQRTIGDAAWWAMHLQWRIAQCHVYIYRRVQIFSLFSYLLYNWNYIKKQKYIVGLDLRLAVFKRAFVLINAEIFKINFCGFILIYSVHDVWPWEFLRIKGFDWSLTVIDKGLMNVWCSLKFPKVWQCQGYHTNKPFQQNLLCYCSRLRFITQKTDIGQTRAPPHPTTLKWRITVSKLTEREMRKHTDGLRQTERWKGSSHTCFQPSYKRKEKSSHTPAQLLIFSCMC